MLIEFIESNILRGEPLPKTVTNTSSVVLLSITFCINFMIVFMLSWLPVMVEDELIFDLDQGTLIQTVRSRFSRLLKRKVRIKNRAVLSNYSKVALRIDSESDWDHGQLYYYPLVLINDSSNNCFQIDCSKRFSSTDELHQSGRKEFARLENLGHQLADFLRMPVVLETEKRTDAQPTASGRVTSNDSAKEIETTVEQLYRLLKSNFGTIHEYRIVNSEAFRGYVDLAYYHRLQSALVDKGYIWAGDVEDMTLAEYLLEEYHTRTFIRLMINPTYNTSIAICHLGFKKLPGFLVQILLGQMKSIDCETEFSSEKYLVTTKAKRSLIIRRDLMWLTCPGIPAMKMSLKPITKDCKKRWPIGTSPQHLYIV